MTLFTAILLGLIQGVAEFLPISSSGHLAIAEHVLSVGGVSEVPPFYDVLLHLGTLAAVFVAYWHDIREMILEFFRGIRDLVRHSTPARVPPARRMILLIIAGTLPLLLVLPVKRFVEGLADNMYFIGFALLITGTLLFLSDRSGSGRLTEKNAPLLSALLVGVAQAFATCPGLSRSGTTISTGCFLGFDRRFAVRFSFLLSIPAVLGAGILSVKDAAEAGVSWGELPFYLVGMAVAAVVGFACLRLLRMIADRGQFGIFAWYCWSVGILTLLLTAIG